MNARIQAARRPVILRPGFLGVLAVLIVIAALAATIDFSPDAKSSSPGIEGVSREGSLELRSTTEASRLADPAASERAGTAATLRGQAEVQRQLSSAVLGTYDEGRRPHGFSGDSRAVNDGWVGPRAEESDYSASPLLRRPE